MKTKKVNIAFLVLVVGLMIGSIISLNPNPFVELHDIVELDIVDFDLCDVDYEIVETRNVTLVQNYTKYNFYIDNGTIYRNSTLINQSAFKIPFFAINTTYTHNSSYTFSTLGFGVINSTVIPFFQDLYYYHIPESQTPAISNITFAYDVRPINSNYINFNETSSVTFNGNNDTIRFNKSGWYSIEYSYLDDIELLVNGDERLFDSVVFTTRYTLIFINFGDHLVSVYHDQSRFYQGDNKYPAVYLGYQDGSSDFDNEVACRNIFIEYMGS